MAFVLPFALAKVLLPEFSRQVCVSQVNYLGLTGGAGQGGRGAASNVLSCVPLLLSRREVGPLLYVPIRMPSAGRIRMW